MDIDEIRNKLRKTAIEQFKALKLYRKYKAKADKEQKKFKELEKLYVNYRLMLIDLQINTMENTINALIYKVV